MSTMNENNRLLTCCHTRGLWPQELFAHCADSLPTEPDKAKLTLQFTGWPFSKPLVFFLLWHFKEFSWNETTHWEQIPQNKFHETNLESKNQYFIKQNNVLDQLNSNNNLHWVLIRRPESKSTENIMCPDCTRSKNACTSRTSPRLIFHIAAHTQTTRDGQGYSCSITWLCLFVSPSCHSTNTHTKHTLLLNKQTPYTDCTEVQAV